MVAQVDRSIGARESREPDLFLSHSSRDKQIVRRIADDLSFLEVDAWLDEWELQAGDSLYDVISAAMERARYVAVVVGDYYQDSRWARDELKQALARDRRKNAATVVPLVFGSAVVPPFLEERVYLDLSEQKYYEGVARLAAMIHDISRHRIETALSLLPPKSIADCVGLLRHCGIEPYVVIGLDDWEEIEHCGGTRYLSGRLRFDPWQISRHPNCSPHIRNLMHRLLNEVWRMDS